MEVKRGGAWKLPMIEKFQRKVVLLASMVAAAVRSGSNVIVILGFVTSCRKSVSSHQAFLIPTVS